MAYLFKGTLRGALCRECDEPLTGVTLRLYRPASERETTVRAVAAAKDTFALVADDAARAKQDRLLAEGTVDADGRFALELPEDYQGDAFEADLHCATVPGRKGPPPRPLQVTVTTVQPMWRASEHGQIAGWDYVVPQRFWCQLRGRLGAWVICGRVTHCPTKAPIRGLTVRAYDVDWLQDDALGTGVTDGSGHFRIDYVPDAFRQTLFSPLINLEWVGGPDLYFQVETVNGTVLLREPRSRGRTADRENAGPCTCVELCVERNIDQPPAGLLPVFDALGGYLFASAIDATVPGTGRTSDGRAFYSTVRLNGVLPTRLNNQPLEYRFEFRRTDAAGNPLAPWTPIAPSQFAATLLGRRERLVGTTIVTSNVYVDPVKPGGGPDHAVIAGDWIQVPQWNDVFSPAGAFAPNGNLLNVITAALVASPTIDVNGVVAGASSTALGAPLSANQHVGLRMRVREVGNPASETDAGTCAHVAIDNTRYANVAKGGSWAPWLASDQLCVASIDAAELRGNGCAGVNADLTALFTATHPNLGDVTVSMTGPGGPYAFTLPAPVPGEQFGTAIKSFNFSLLPNCAYIVKLSVGLLLTTGDSSPLPIGDEIGFCKK